MSFLHKVAGLSLRDRVRSSDIRRELRVEPLLPGASPERFSGHVRLGGDPGKTQNPLEGLYISSGLGTPQDPSGGTGECGWGEGSLGGPA